VPRTQRRSFLGSIAAAITGALSLFSTPPSESAEAASSRGSRDSGSPSGNYWEGVAADPIDYEDSVENLDTVEDDELLG